MHSWIKHRRPKGHCKVVRKKVVLVILTQHEKFSLNHKFSHLSKALQQSFNEKMQVPLQWDFLSWLFPMTKRQESRFLASAMLYTFAVLLSSKFFALYLFCSGLNAQWQHKLYKSVDKCCNTINRKLIFFFKMLMGLSLFCSYWS